METLLKAKIEAFDYCIYELSDDLQHYNGVELFSDTYYEIQATVERFKQKRQELVDQLENNQ